MHTPRFVDQALGELGITTSLYLLEIADEHIDEFAPAGREDLVLRYARPVPLRAMAGLVGMDERYAAGIGQSVPAILDGSRYAQQADTTLMRLCRQLVDERRAAPGPDLVSWMLHYAPADLSGSVPHQVRRLILGVVAHSTVSICQALRSRIPSAGKPVALADSRPIRDGFDVSARGWSLVEMVRDTAVDRLLHRLPDMRLPVPGDEVLPTSLLGLDCPAALPAVFTPVRVSYTGDEEISWLPAPNFTAAPPRKR